MNDLPGWRYLERRVLLASWLTALAAGLWVYPRLWTDGGDPASWAVMLAVVAASVAAVRRVVVPPLGALAGSLCAGSSLLLGIGLNSFLHLRPLPVLLMVGSVGLVLALTVGHIGRRFGGRPTWVSKMTAPRRRLRGGRRPTAVVRRGSR